MNLKDVSHFSAYLPTNKKIQDLLDRHSEDLRRMIGQPFVHLTGIKYKVRKENGWHYHVHALADRHQEIEVVIYSSTVDSHSHSVVVDARETCPLQRLRHI